MTKKQSRGIKIGCLALAGVVGISATLGYTAEDAAASSRMYGVQQVVENITEEDHFKILEIVPDYADSAIGYYVKGYEPALSGSLFTDVASAAARAEKVRTLMSDLAAKGIVFFTENATAATYEEMLYENGSGEYQEMSVLPSGQESGSYAEDRVGSYVAIDTLDLSAGNYSYGPYVSVGQSVELASDYTSAQMTIRLISNRPDGVADIAVIPYAFYADENGEITEEAAAGTISSTNELSAISIPDDGFVDVIYQYTPAPEDNGKTVVCYAVVRITDGQTSTDYETDFSFLSVVEGSVVIETPAITGAEVLEKTVDGDGFSVVEGLSVNENTVTMTVKVTNTAEAADTFTVVPKAVVADADGNATEELSVVSFTEADLTDVSIEAGASQTFTYVYQARVEDKDKTILCSATVSKADGEPVETKKTQIHVSVNEEIIFIPYLNGTGVVNGSYQEEAFVAVQSISVSDGVATMTVTVTNTSAESKTFTVVPSAVLADAEGNPTTAGVAVTYTEADFTGVTIEAGASQTFTYSYQARLEDADQTILCSAVVTDANGVEKETKRAKIEVSTVVEDHSEPVLNGVSMLDNASQAAEFTVDQNPATNSNYVTMTVTVTNTGTEDNTFTVSPRAVVADADGNATEEASEVVYTASELTDITIAAGASQTFTYVYQARLADKNKDILCSAVVTDANGNTAETKQAKAAVGATPNDVTVPVLSGAVMTGAPAQAEFTVSQNSAVNEDVVSITVSVTNYGAENTFTIVPNAVLADEEGNATETASVVSYTEADLTNVTIGAGASQTFTYSYQARVEDKDATVLCSAVITDADGNSKVTKQVTIEVAANPETLQEAVLDSADLLDPAVQAAGFTASQNVVVSEDTATLTVTVTNPGTEDKTITIVPKAVFANEDAGVTDETMALISTEDNGTDVVVSAGSSLTFTYRYQALAEDDGKTILCSASVTDADDHTIVTETVKIVVAIEEAYADGLVIVDAGTKIREKVRLNSDYHYTPGMGGYVWVDSEDGELTNVTFDTIYYKTNVVGADVFARDILELDLDSETEKEQVRGIEVISMTAAELESALINNELALSDIDLIYLSNSSLYDLTGLTLNSYAQKDGDGNLINDLSAQTCENIVSFVTGAYLPVIIDSTILSDSSLAGTQVAALAKTLYAQTALGSHGAVLENVYVCIGSVVEQGLTTYYVRKNLADGTYFSSENAAVNGETYLVGIDEVTSDLELDNTYNKSAGTECVSEYNENTKALYISDATAIKYILNYAERRTVLYKDVLNVLDLEPTKFSTLTTAKIREWLGESNEFNRIQTINITQMSTDEFIGRIEDLIENYDLIYIGSCQGNKSTVTTDKIYSHIGSSASTTDTRPKGLLSANEVKSSGYNSQTLVTVYSGNDISEKKYEQLVEFVKAGYPVVVDSQLMSADGTVNTTNVDVNSWMYQFLYNMGHDHVETSTISEAVYNQVTSNGTIAVDGYRRIKVIDQEYRAAVEAVEAYWEIGNQVTQITSGEQYVVRSKSDPSYYLTANNAANSALGVQSKNFGTQIKASSGDFAAFSNYVWNSNGSVLTKTSSNGRTLKIGYNNGWTLSENGNVSLTYSTNNAGFYMRYSYGNGYRYVNRNSGSLNYVTSRGNNSYWDIYKVTYQAAVEAQEEVPEVFHYECYRDRVTEAYANVISTQITGTSKELANLVKYVNTPRLNLLMIDQPTEYKATTDGNGQLVGVSGLNPVNNKYTLTYDFIFTNPSEASNSRVYSVHLYIDTNADGSYVSAEEMDGLEVKEAATGKRVATNALESGVRYIVTRELPSGYVGLLPWKLVVELNTTSGSTAVRSSEIGYTYVAKTGSGIETVKVLQILPNESGFPINDTDCKLTDSNTTMGALLNKACAALNMEIDLDFMYVSQCPQSEYNGGYCTGRHVTGGTYLNDTLNGYSNSDGNRYYEEYLKQYDMIVIGFQDSFGSADPDYTTCKAFYDGLTLYIQSGKPVLLSHDLTSFNNSTAVNKKSGLANTNDSLPYYTNQYLRDLVGMDRFGIVTAENGISTLLRSKTADYIMTAAQKSLIEDADKDIAIKSDGKTSYLTQGFSDTFIDLISNTSTSNWKTARISQVNEGQITMYPYDINITALTSEANPTAASDTNAGNGAEETNTYRMASGSYYVEMTNKATIAITHTQYYQLDYNYSLNDSDMVVWFTLAATDSSNGAYYDRIPNDVQNNYYIYTVGNLTYTGMGDSMGRGHGNHKLSLIEAQLFVNTVIAAYNNSTKSARIEIVKDVNSKNTSIDYIYRTYDEVGTLDETSKEVADATVTTVDNESFAFYVQDNNVFQGKTYLAAWGYTEVTAAAYNALTDAQKAATFAVAVTYNGVTKNVTMPVYSTTVADDGTTIYLMAYSANASDANYIGNVLTTFTSSVQNNIAVGVEVNGSWLDTQMSAADSSLVRIYIGARSLLDYDAANKQDELTQTVFDSIAFRRRTMLDLD